MKAQETIIAELNQVVEKFPQLQIKYDFDASDNTHSIEVLPLSFYKNNKDYADFEMDFTFRMIKEFPYHFLFFVSDETMHQIEKPTIIITGKAFVEEDRHENLLVLDL